MAKRKPAAKKKPATTTYQRKTRRISRWRSFKRGLASFLRRGYYAVGVATVLLAVGLGWWWVHSGKLGMVMEEVRQTLLVQTADAGLELRYVYLEGRHNASLEAVTEAIGLEAGDPILGVSVTDMKDRLKQLSWVHDAVIERQLPHTLHVHIIERKPVAVWQHKKQLKLIDQVGAIIHEGDGRRKEYANLLLVVGEDAPDHALELLHVLASEPELYSRAEAAIRMGNRRWDVRLRNGVTVKLPAKDMQRAWALLAKMEKEQSLLERNVRTVDLRLEDRVFIDLPPDARDMVTPASLGGRNI